MAEQVYQFTPAIKAPTFVRCALMGASGTGKTFTALEIARGMFPDGRIAVIDTESGKSQYYARYFKFEVLVLHDHSPASYGKAMKAAYDQKVDVLIIDSITHEWEYVLGWVDDMQNRNMDKRQAWGRATPEHKTFVDRIAHTYPGHIISTIRAERKMTILDTGKTIMQMQPVQRDRIEFEFDVLFDVDDDHVIRVAKNNVGIFNTKDNKFPIGTHAELGQKLLEWAAGDGKPQKIWIAPDTTPEVATRPFSPEALLDELRAEAEATRGAKPTLITPANMKHLHASFGKLSKNDIEIKAFVQAVFGHASRKQLATCEYEAVVNWIDGDEELARQEWLAWAASYQQSVQEEVMS